jgi:hypothetical protein
VLFIVYWWLPPPVREPPMRNLAAGECVVAGEAVKSLYCPGAIRAPRKGGRCLIPYGEHTGGVRRSRARSQVSADFYAAILKG